MPMNLRHPHVRHLHWSISSQELAFAQDIGPLDILDQEEIDHWCQQLDQNPKPLDQYIHAHEHRLLGSYFEVLWQFFLSHHPKWTLLGSRIQIPPSGPTVGELDILCEHEQEVMHVELAIKVYLRHPQRDGLQTEHWIGPRTRDRLDLKLEKLEQKQFQMLAHPSTQQTLSELGLPLSATPKSVIKGYLFDPLSTPSASCKRPPQANTSAEFGHWLHSSQIDEAITQFSHWQIIDKWQWLGPYREDGQPLTAQQAAQRVKAHFLKPDYALMLVALKPESDGWLEQARFMVVDDDWPYDHSALINS